MLAFFVGLALGVGPHYPHTIDCRASSMTPGWTVKNTCNLEGDFSAINARTLPSWYADMKFGIFIHWGIYSVPSFGSEWYWHNSECGNTAVKSFQDRVYGKNMSYLDFAPQFKAELFNATQWVDVFKTAGASYVLPVGKHHDGFCMWDARDTSPGWNAYEVGPERDVMTELYNATLDAGLDFGIYYSQFEFFDKDFVADRDNNFTTNTFVTKKVEPQRLELVKKFPKAMLWHTDGGWMAPDAYWGNLDWLTYLYSKSPLAERVVSCNSMGVGCCINYGGGKCYEYGDAPSGGDRTTAGKIQPHFYTNQMTIQKSSWSWDRSEIAIDQFLTTAELVFTIVSTTAWNGTTVINVGPTADGLMPPIFQSRLTDLGEWLGVNGEAVHGSRPWLPGQEPASSCPYTLKTGCLFYTQQVAAKKVYAISLQYPPNNTLTLTQIKECSKVTKAELLMAGGNDLSLKHDCTGGNLVITFPPPPLGTAWGWTVRLSGLN